MFQGTACDLITGEERRLMGEDGGASDHVACTVEMTSVNTPCKCHLIFFSSHLQMTICDNIDTYECCFWSSDEVAVIDEIQMVRDKQRGWAWTRALLGKA